MATVSAGRPCTGDAPPIAWADGDEPEENGTSHFVAVDQWGNAVSYTSTVEGSFGSGLMVGGYYLNNELTDFSFSPEADGQPVANRVEGGKRPRSSMAPTLVYGQRRPAGARDRRGRRRDDPGAGDQGAHRRGSTGTSPRRTRSRCRCSIRPAIAITIEQGTVAAKR